MRCSYLLLSQTNCRNVKSPREHIAAAILSNCDIIVSWNFKHIVNVKTIRGIKVVTTMEGYKDILIYPPTALLEEVD